MTQRMYTYFLFDSGFSYRIPHYCLDRRANEEGYMHPSYMAIIYIGLGENQKALELLEKGFNDKDFLLVWIESA